MPMIIPPPSPSQLPSAELKPSFRQPHFDCTDLPQALTLRVFVPGVHPSGVEITASGPDFGITARKTHLVRVNFPSLHLEGVQRDYQLKLRLGVGYDYAALRAELSDGVLTVWLPKRQRAAPPVPAHRRYVA